MTSSASIRNELEIGCSTPHCYSGVKYVNSFPGQTKDISITPNTDIVVVYSGHTYFEFSTSIN